MLRILAFFVIFYFLFKLGGFILRMLMGGLGAKAAYQQTNQRSQNGQQQRKRSSADGISIDYVPDDQNKRSAKNYKGGEYVDYEEVK